MQRLQRLQLEFSMPSKATVTKHAEKTLYSESEGWAKSYVTAAVTSPVQPAPQPEHPWVNQVP